MIIRWLAAKAEGGRNLAKPQLVNVATERTRILEAGVTRELYGGLPGFDRRSS